MRGGSIREADRGGVVSAARLFPDGQSDNSRRIFAAAVVVDDMRGRFPRKQSRQHVSRAVAHPSKVYPGRRWVSWQYSGSGLSHGMRGRIDLNVFHGDERLGATGLAAADGGRGGVGTCPLRYQLWYKIELQSELVDYLVEVYSLIQEKIYLNWMIFIRVSSAVHYFQNLISRPR
ncbi:hypothetical protein BQ8794_10046 [Mesorhizobium prunaredense]|uniref:Uncharacterized protein n=1 Tax=Mesorhizobium prunaredense TaxID=1631249 RepID=A0A1R3UYF9_9HYPH|nr:hypothetical protein BQ8794_10046 [Mesorhizobium prunaredense]